MRLLTVFLFAATLAVSARPAAQTITLSGKNLSLEKVFSAIKKQTGLVVFFNQELLADTRPITLAVRDMPLDEFLTVALKDQPLSAWLEGKTIVLSRKASLTLSALSFQIASPEGPATISGRIIDNAGKPIPNVSVSIKNSSVDGTTDAEGRFSLAFHVAPTSQTPSDRGGSLSNFPTLVVSAPGFIPLVKTLSSFSLPETDFLIPIRGIVSNPGGEPLLGVTVQIKGKKDAVTTNARGYFEIEVSDGAVLVFSSVGYQTKEVTVNGNTMTINMILSPVVSPLDEVVVVGFGTQKKVNLTGSVATVTSDAFARKTMSTPLEALQGMLPGAAVTRRNGRPGYEAYDIQIRGASSVNSTNVLVMIDGVRAPSFRDINPNDIESISVLKDAAAGAIYGSNAAGGVILITTKKGKRGGTKINYSGSYGLTQAARMPHRLKTWDEMAYWDQALMNTSGTIAYGPIKMAWARGEQYDVIDTIGVRTGVRPSDFFPGQPFVIDPGRPNVWLSYGDFDQIEIALKKDNPIQSHNISISGSGEKSLYYISAGYYERDGILRHTRNGERKYNARANYTNNFSEKISFSSSLNYANTDIFQPITAPEVLIQNAYKLWGWIAPMRPDGQYHVGNGVWPSPIQKQRDEGRNDTKAHTVDGFAKLTIDDLLKGLQINVVGQKRMEISSGYAYLRTLTNTGAAGIAQNFNPTNKVTRASSLVVFNSLQAFGTYDFKIAAQHNFKLLGGYSFEDSRAESTSASISNLTTNDFFSLNWGDPQTGTMSDNVVTYASAGYFGRLSYDFDNRYLFEANVRYDGSSRLAPGNRWQLFPSFSTGWVLGNEKFFPESKVLSNLKFRASWGKLGNSSALGNYDYIGLLNAAKDVPLGNVRNTRIFQPTMASPEKTWEVIETSNIGVDLFLFRNRLTVTGESYVKKNKNMLAPVSISSMIGVGVSTYNIGELKTDGWEFNLEWKDKYRQFSYWASVNLSNNTNKLLNYGSQNAVSAGLVPLLEGMPLNTVWGYKTGGLFQSKSEYDNSGVFISAKTGEGDMKYLDLDGNKRISIGNGTLEDHGDLVLLGNNNPQYIFGLNMGFNWKGINFSCLFQGVGKRSFFMDNTDLVPFILSWKMPFAEQSDYWTPENPDAFWPRPYTESDHSYWPSDYWLQNGAYVRLKNVVIGYTLPKSLIKRASLQEVNIYLSGQNVFEFTKTFPFVDPEYPSNATTIYPFFRTYQLGLQLTF